MHRALRLLAATALTALAVGAAAPAGASSDGDRAVFTGSFVRPATSSDGGTRRYQVEVSSVYGDVDVPRRVTVESPQALESCRPPRAGGVGQGLVPQQGGAQQQQAPGSGTTTTPPAQPSSPTTSPSGDTSSEVVDKRRRLFDTLVMGGRYVVTGCADVQLVDTDDLTALTSQFGEPRPPGVRPQQPGPGLDDVGYLCPDTRDALDFGDTASCDALVDDTDLDRAAAPGLALVIVGLLGFLLARRLGRR